MKLDRLQRALQTGNWGQAADILGLLVAGADPHPSMMYNYGKVLIELGRMAQAQAMLRRAVQAMPGHSAAWFELGRVALSAEDFETSFEAFSRALDLEPTTPMRGAIWDGLGCDWGGLAQRRRPGAGCVAIPRRTGPCTGLRRRLARPTRRTCGGTCWIPTRTRRR